MLRIEKPKTNRVLSLLPWSDGPGPQPAEVKDSEQEIKTDPTNGLATLSLKLDQGGIYRLRATGTDRFGQTITSQARLKSRTTQMPPSCGCSPRAPRSRSARMPRCASIRG